MDDTRWDHGLTVTGEGQGLVGHALIGAGRQPARNQDRYRVTRVTVITVTG